MTNVLFNLKNTLEILQKKSYTSAGLMEELKKAHVGDPITFAKKMRDRGLVVIDNSKAARAFPLTLWTLSEKGKTKLQQLQLVLDDDIVEIAGAAI